MLPSEVLKEIEKGPRANVNKAYFRPVWERREDPRQFATRIAELATKLEREACAEVVREISVADLEGEQFGAIEARGRAAEAIESRGKE